MFAIHQMIDDPQDFIAVPQELRHRPTEVIIIALDPPQDASCANPDQQDCVDAFRGKGKGGAVARLLQDRQSDRERDA